MGLSKKAIESINIVVCGIKLEALDDETTRLNEVIKACSGAPVVEALATCIAVLDRLERLLEACNLVSSDCDGYKNYIMRYLCSLTDKVELMIDTCDEVHCG